MRQPFLQRLQQTDASPTAADEQDGAGLKLLGPALLNLLAIAHVDRPAHLKEQSAMIGNDLKGGDERGPLTVT